MLAQILKVQFFDDSLFDSYLGVVHILRNHRGGGRGFPNDYASVIFTQ